MKESSNLTVWQGEELPKPTPELSKSLQPHELEGHRSRICFDVEVILQGYWQSMPPVEIKTAMLADWADSLEDWHHKQVLWALRKWRNENPNKKPNPGHILGLLKEARGKAEAAKAPKPTPQPELVNTDTSEARKAYRKAYADSVMRGDSPDVSLALADEARIKAELMAGYTEKE